MPTEIRTVPGPIPAAARAAASSWWWEVEAGCITRVFTSPRETLREASRTASTKVRPAVPAAYEVDGDHPAAATGQQPCGDLPVGVARQGGVAHGRDRRVRGEPGGQVGGARALALHAQGQGLHAAQGEPGGERVGGRALFDGVVADAAVELVVLEDGDAAEDVRVPGEVLGGGVDDDVGALVEGRQRSGEAKVLSTATGTPASAATAASAGRSETRVVGLAMVSR